MLRIPGCESLGVEEAEVYPIPEFSSLMFVFLDSVESGSGAREPV